MKTLNSLEACRQFCEGRRCLMPALAKRKPKVPTVSPVRITRHAGSSPVETKTFHTLFMLPRPKLGDRFGEAAFRRYEAVIATAVAALPIETEIDARAQFGLSPETVAARLRDAMRALYHNKGWSTTVNRPRFEAYYVGLAVAQRAGTVVVKLRSHITPRELPDTQSVDVPNRLAFAGEPQQATLDAVLDWADRDVLSGVRLVGLAHMHARIANLAANLNVAVTTDGNDLILL